MVAEGNRLMIEDVAEMDPESELRSMRYRITNLPRNPNDTAYVDWLIAVIDGFLPEPEEEAMSSLKKIG
jgi:hypothetical protein